MKTDFLLLPMLFCFVGAIAVIGMTFALYSDQGSGSSVSAETSNPSGKETEPFFLIKGIEQLKEMDLLDLIDLKREIEFGFESLKSDFEVDVSGILDIFSK